MESFNHSIDVHAQEHQVSSKHDEADSLALEVLESLKLVRAQTDVKENQGMAPAADIQGYNVRLADLEVCCMSTAVRPGFNGVPSCI